MTREEMIAALIVIAGELRSESALLSANHSNRTKADYLMHKSTVMQYAAEVLRGPTEPPMRWKDVQALSANVLRDRAAGTRQLIDALLGESRACTDRSSEHVLRLAAFKLEEWQ